MDKRTCKICKNKKKNKILAVQDWNDGIEKKFYYMRCKNCGCLQLLDIPENMTNYYSKTYYSFKMNKKTSFSENLIQLFVKKRDIYELTRKGRIGAIISQLQPRIAYQYITKLTKKTDNILDIGCGDGYLVKLMNKIGYQKLLGIDPFYQGKEKLIKRMDIFDIDSKEKFDFIMLHHSFEHMKEPVKILEKCKDLLSPKGRCMICIPLADSYAFKKYGKYWVQLDAPRHIFLHTKKSIEILAAKLQLQIENIIYDSNSFQFIGSEFYQRNIPGYKRRNLKNVIKFVIQSIKYASVSNRMNQEKQGDQAIFLLKN